MKTKEEIDKEFDKLTPDSFVDDNSYYDEKEWLKNNEHLYTGTMYDEPAFTLDKEKVRIFIHSKLAQQKQEMVENLPKIDPIERFGHKLEGDSVYDILIQTAFIAGKERILNQIKQNLTK